jgi:glycine cleavage system H protein
MKGGGPASSTVPGRQRHPRVAGRSFSNKEYILGTRWAYERRKSMADKSAVKDGLRYTVDHEWVKVEGGNARVGITDHAQKELTEIVFVELPKVGKKYQHGDVLGQVESVKTVASLYAPLSGEVIEVNSELENQTQLINESPYDKGWFAIIKMDDPSAAAMLMDAPAYRKALGE